MGPMSAVEIPIPLPALPRVRDWRPIVGLMLAIDAAFVVINGIWFAALPARRGPAVPA